MEKVFPELFYGTLVLFGGIIFVYLAKPLKLPNVTGYILCGLIIGPYMLNWLPLETLEAMNVFSEAALGFIAFSVGAEFRLSYFKKMGSAPFIIAFFAGFLASAIVFVSLVLMGFDVNECLLVAAIASATAPAAVVMVVNEYKAKGPVTETMLSVVAIDDAIAILLFGFAVAIVDLNTNGAGGSLLMSMIKPTAEIIAALLIGGLMAVIFKFSLRVVKGRSNRLSLSIAFVVAGVAIAQMLKLSDLLLCMSMSGVLINIAPCTPQIMRDLDEFTPPLFLVFFVLSGAGLNLATLPQIGAIGLAYVFSRVAGKVIGAYTGAALSKSPESVKKYIGLTLLPQAGVAIGMVSVAAEIVPQYADTIRGVVLCSTLLYEIFGPAIAKMALIKAGEIKVAN